MAWNVPAEMPRNQSRLQVVAAADAGADDKRDLLARVELLAGCQITQDKQQPGGGNATKECDPSDHDTCSSADYRAFSHGCLCLTGAAACGLIARHIWESALKAIVVREFGPPNVMKLEDVPMPEPKAAEVLIKVHAVSVNRTLDCVVRAGKYARRVTLPLTPGVDPSGVIEKLGSGVTDRQVGDRVTVQLRTSQDSGADSVRNPGVHAWGGYAQYVCARADRTALIPDGLDFATATVVSRHAPTAFTLLRDRAKLQPGEWVLVMGASGGLGSAGVQVAKYLGARVIAAAGADDRVKVGIDLGADAGVNYRTHDLTIEAMRITEGKGVNVVFENIGDPTTFPKAFAAMARRGRLVTAGGHGGTSVPLDVNRLYQNHLSIIGATGETPDDVTLALKAAAEGKFKGLIDRVMPLSQAVQAHEWVESRDGLGKVILDPTKA
jgi:NADPH:quinone reductase-like Zn-dependent oxidoreductase